jgi:predicted porin
MKKTLIALAALAATGAFAQSTVTITGLVDVAVQNVSTAVLNGQTGSVTGLTHSKQSTNGIIFKGVEDLGGGLKASFLYELDMDPTKGGSLSAAAANPNDVQVQNGEIYVGVEGGFGSVKLGVPNTPSLTTQASRTPFGTKTGSGFGGTSGAGRVRTNGSIVYATPSFSGVTAAISYTPATANAATASVLATRNLADISDIGVNYANGPVAAGVSFYNQEGVSTQTNFYASYVLGAAKLIVGGHREDNKVAGASDTLLSTMALPIGTSTGYNVAGTYSLTPAFTLLGNYAKLNEDNATSYNKKLTAVGAKYELSKRTSVYARYGAENFENVVGAFKTTDIKTTMVGVMHSF